MVYVIVVLIAINIFSFIAIGWDKEKSKSEDVRRMPEGEIFFWAAAWGAFGVYIGMLVFRHKTRKWYFIIGIPLLILENLASAYLMYWLLNFNNIDFFESGGII